MLSLGSEVDVRNTGGHSALHVAAYLDNFEAVRLLLSYNADVILCDRWNQTPLHRAAGKLKEKETGVCGEGGGVPFFTLPTRNSPHPLYRIRTS